MTMRTCPILNCNHPITDKQVTCSRHWELLDPALRKAVHEAKQDRSSPAYKTAVAAAVAGINGLVRAKIEAQQEAAAGY